VRVHVVSFTDSAIRMNVLAWFQTTDWSEFLMIRHRMLLTFLRIIEQNNSSFALPSRTIYHVTSSGGAPGASGPPAIGE
jgi:MscS family membrane protein